MNQQTLLYTFVYVSVSSHLNFNLSNFVIIERDGSATRLFALFSEVRYIVIRAIGIQTAAHVILMFAKIRLKA